MFRHVVMFSWSGKPTEAQLQAIAGELGQMPDRIDVIRRYQFGPDAGINPGNCDFVVVADFDDAAGYLAYRDHPAHRKFIEDYLNPIVARRSAVQYQI